MSHPDQEDLVTFALGEPTDATVPSHVAGCATCTAQVDRLHDVVAATTGLGREPIVLESPPDHVWSAIVAATSDQTIDGLPARTAAPRRARRGRGLLAGGAVGFAAGVAATVVVLLTLGSLALGRDDPPAQPPQDTGRVIAAGAVRPFGTDRTTTGSATVVELHDTRSMRIRLDGAPRTASTFVQAWLLDPRNNDMIALGVMGGSTETFSLPKGVDLEDYSSVDISLEPFDGDPQHSAVSLARGALTSR